MVLSYGVKSTPEIYNNEDLIGYKLITLSEAPFGLDSIKDVEVKYE